MFDLDKWQEIFDSIRRHKLRTILTALSVWWGIFMLIILLGAGNGLSNSAEHSFADEAKTSLWMWGGKTSVEYKGLPTGRYINFDNQDYQDIKAEVGKIPDMTGRYFMWRETNIKKGNKSLSFTVEGIHPAYQIVEDVTVLKGRYISDEDVEQARKVCVIGKDVKEAFFKPNANIIGEELMINNIVFTIVGEFTDQWKGMMQRIYIPLTTCQRLASSTDRIHSLIANMDVKNLRQSEKVVDKVVTILARNHNFDPADEQAIYISNNLEDSREMNMVLGVIKGFIWFVGIGSILAGVIGVSNIMLIIVKERTKEIGIRKAMGATPKSIISMILSESILLTTVAGYIGLLAGFSIVNGLGYIMRVNEVELEFFRNPEVNFAVVLSALILLIVSGALAGYFPARRAAQISPVIAMKE